VFRNAQDQLPDTFRFTGPTTLGVGAGAAAGAVEVDADRVDGSGATESSGEAATAALPAAAACRAIDGRTASPVNTATVSAPAAMLRTH
jgi:hypothetical protein